MERLLAVERTFAEQRECWLVQQDELLTWQLRVEAAESRLAQHAETSTRTARALTSSEKKT